MAKTQFESLGVFERAALARAIQTHGIVLVLREAASLVKSDLTRKALTDAINKINGNLEQRQEQRQSSPDSPVLQ